MKASVIRPCRSTIDRCPSADIAAIREYILSNPARWGNDENNAAFAEQQAQRDALVR